MLKKMKTTGYWFNIICIVIIGIGIFFRISEYVQNRSLWLDEAKIAERMERCSLQDLNNSEDTSCLLRYPPGFLALQKTVAALLGSNAFALRLMPLLIGCLAMLVFFSVVRHVVSPPFALFGLALFSLSPTMIFYSSESKPYIFDVAASLAIMWMCFQVLSGRLSGKRMGYVCAAACVITWFSFPALYIVIITGAVSALCYRHERKQFGQFLVLSGVGLVNAVIYCLVFLKSFHAEPVLYTHWQAGFLNWSNVESILRMLCDRLVYIDFWIFFVVCIIGLSFLIRDSRKGGVFVWSALLAAVSVSIFKIYPLWDRSALFLVPLALIVVVRGMEGICYSANKKLRWFFRPLIWVLIAFMVGFPLGISVKQFMNVYGAEEVRPAIEYLKKYRKLNEKIFVYYGAKAAVRYYAPRYGVSSNDYVLSVSSRTMPSAYARQITDISKGRVWFLGTHFFHDEYAVFMKEFLKHCHQEDAVIWKTCAECPCPSLNKTQGIAAALHLFDCSKGKK